jgi:hypothetical protein
MIFKDGLYLGLLFCAASISVWILSLISLAIAVPSIFVAVIAIEVLEKALLGFLDFKRGVWGRRGKLIELTGLTNLTDIGYKLWDRQRTPRREGECVIASVAGAVPQSDTGADRRTDGRGNSSNEAGGFVAVNRGTRMCDFLRRPTALGVLDIVDYPRQGLFMLNGLTSNFCDNLCTITIALCVAIYLQGKQNLERHFGRAKQ